MTKKTSTVKCEELLKSKRLLHRRSNGGAGKSYNFMKKRLLKAWKKSKRGPCISWCIADVEDSNASGAVFNESLFMRSQSGLFFLQRERCHSKKKEKKRKIRRVLPFAFRKCYDGNRVRTGHMCTSHVWHARLHGPSTQNTLEAKLVITFSFVANAEFFE